jgi:probable F420-dependent oxidoreductase
VAEYARRAEALGYAVLTVPDHFRCLPPVPTLAFAAAATTTLRLACTVFAVDFRHPAMVAREAAMLDLVSGGRFDCGLGAGWQRSEFEQAGIPFDSPATRVDRLDEAVRLIKQLWRGQPVNFAGEHYRVSDLNCVPLPVQAPYPPVFIGGGGKRLLSLAAREADIVGLQPKATVAGGLDWRTSTDDVLTEKIDWVRQAAGDRFDLLELSTLVARAIVTDNRATTAASVAAERGLTQEQVLAAPEFMIGSVEYMVERVLSQRERFGVSYLIVAEPDPEAMAPVVARLGGR